jgi:uncharacterized protein YgbK (DUF1537 family)
MIRRFRLLADDLTGALDSAARFVAEFGPVPIAWHDLPAVPALAIDSVTREADEATAIAAMRRLAPELAGADLAFKKLDSLLRGHVAAEIAACLATGGFDHAVIAPAFPGQGRVTRGGRQIARGVDVGVDLAADLAAHGVAVRLCRPGDAAPAGVSLWDGADRHDLDRVVAAGRAMGGRILWCGSGGLAGALGSRATLPAADLPRPRLAMFGSDHPVARAQMAAAPHRCTLASPDDAAALAATLADGAAVDIALPAGISRHGAAERIAASFAALAHRLPRPGTLIISGGGTLRGLCDALGASHLVVFGEIEPGVPLSRMVGGVWDGLMLVSKSGAFGEADFLCRLLGGHGDAMGVTA